VNLARFDLNLLVALDALLREKNVTRAGQRIGLSQPAMSGTLGRLRELFHDDLLVRVGRQLELTPLAQELIEPVRKSIESIEDVVGHKRAFDPATEERSFTVATSDYATFLLFQPLMERLTVEAPRVTVRFSQLSGKSTDLLAHDMIDFLIMPSEIESSFPKQMLFTDRWACAVWDKHPDIGHRISEKQYLSLPHLAFNLPQPEGWSVADHYLASKNIQRRIAATTESFLLSPFMLRGTKLVTIVHRRLGERVKKAAEIKLLDPPYPFPDIHESIFWNPRYATNPPHVWLRNLFVKIAADL
jgi:LysR family nod box-dependent transcriptional activator